MTINLILMLFAMACFTAGMVGVEIHIGGDRQLNLTDAGLAFLVLSMVV